MGIALAYLQVPFILPLYKMQNGKVTFNHFNINVTDISRSVEFYKEALGLAEVGHIDGENGEFKIVYLGDGQTTFRLELTWLKGKVGAYNLGDNESHLCFSVAGDYAKWREFHKQMNCVCFENFAMNLYFIADPDGYWIEILSADRK